MCVYKYICVQIIYKRIINNKKNKAGKAGSCGEQDQGGAPRPDRGAHGGGTGAPPTPVPFPGQTRPRAALGTNPGIPQGRGAAGGQRPPVPQPGSRRHRNPRKMETWKIPAAPRSRRLQRGGQGGFSSRLTPPFPKSGFRNIKKPHKNIKSLRHQLLGLHDNPVCSPSSIHSWFLSTQVLQEELLY